MEIKVIKIGGNVVDNPGMLEKFVEDFARVAGPKVLVHGGGVMASQMQKALGQEPIMIEGRRVTDIEALKVVTMVYAGWCSKKIVALLQKNCCNAIGLCGADACLINAVKRAPIEVGPDRRLVDYGWVGDVDPMAINADFLHGLISHGIVPVISAITHDRQGNLLNTNADTIASSVAIALSADAEVSLTYCFEKDGVLLDKDDEGSMIWNLDKEYYASLKEEGVVAAGMIPKLDNSFRAMDAGVKEVIIKHAKNLLDSRGTYLRK